MEVQTDNFDRFKFAIGRTDSLAQEALDSAAQDISKSFFQSIQQSQPVGKPDELVTRGIWTRRDERPSIRHDHTPISQSWVTGGIQVLKDSESSRTLLLESEDAPHVELFTFWTGRDHLGVRAGDPQVAGSRSNVKTLAFWHNGEARYPTSTPGHGFMWPSDFMQEAWDRVGPGVLERLGSAFRLVITTPLREI